MILQPYLHESRHLHALKRARGCGGRFLTAKKMDNQQKQDESGDKSHVNINHESGKDGVASSANAFDLSNIKDLMGHSMSPFVEAACFHQSRTVVTGQNQGDSGVLYVYFSVDRSE